MALFLFLLHFPTRSALFASLLLLSLLLLIKLRLRCNVVALDAMLGDLPQLPLTTLLPLPIVLLLLLQLQYPLRHLKPADLHHIRDGSQHRLVFLRKKSNRLSFSPRTARPSDPMDVVHSTLHDPLSSLPPAENRN